MINSVEDLTECSMSFLNQCKKYMTFIKLKYASSTNYNESDTEAAALCLAIINNSYEEDDISLIKLLNKSMSLGLFEPTKKTEHSSLVNYLKILEENYYPQGRKQAHEKLIEKIKHSHKTLFSTSFQERNCLLTMES